MLLYIHIPFCDSKCNYCAFNSYTHLHFLRENYMNALLKQLEYELNLKKPRIETVFIGGGTPSTIDASLYKRVIEIIKPYTIDDCEITIEANPNSATYSWQEKIYELGINRISFGVQSFDDEKLNFLNRNHNQYQAVQAIQNAKEIGFKHINCDIIYDTSLDTKALLDNDIQIIKSLPVDHISAYSLTLEEGTKFFNKPSVKKENQQLTQYLFDSLNQEGFTQYEISNFALHSKARSKHNLGYWQYKEYLGVGSGAVGKINNKRTYTASDVQKYINDPIKYPHIETLSKEDIVTEKILLGFRSIVGIDLSILNHSQKQKLNELFHEGKIDICDKKAFAKDYLLADELALFLF